ncbi:MAG: magnesium-translocating P-type ATPase [Parcubacteria group bacterium]|nr:magnesium-translocating P-type ATPase [Parcubacteria group bacterium]
MNTPETISQSGLSSREAEKLLVAFGENSIYHKKKLRPIIAFLQKFNSPLLLLLIGAATLSFFLGQRTNAAIILSMVFISGMMDFINTHKSEKVAESLAARVSATATVYRDGQKREIPLRHLVPGDVVELSAGDVIPADARVLKADDLFVNQSSLTGESFPAEKRPEPVSDVKLFDRTAPLSLQSESVVFMGTSVVTGFATALVLRTGMNAEYGKIAERLSSLENETAFDKGIRDFSMFIVRLTFIMVMTVFAINAYFDRGILDSFLFAVAIAVGLTPELLPVIMTVAQSRGALVMAKKNVVVKNLSAIQNFGGMNILCTDKTGTLTEDKITLIKCVDSYGADSREVLLYAYLGSAYHTARRSPLDAAIEEKAKMDVSMYSKVDEIPFDFHRRRDSVVVQKDGERLLIAKGAPENIFDACALYGENGEILPFSEERRAHAQEEYERLSADGFRVLAVAVKRLPVESRSVYKREEEMEMIFSGFAAFLDPPKQSVMKTLDEMQALDIEIKIITGDSLILTERICRDIGLPVKGALSGSSLDAFTDDELLHHTVKTTVFARTSPEQKERIIRVLRKAGNIVGYMGDGINDAPVLKAADVGISVNNAVDVVKETADIILLEKSLHALKDGVLEGRKTFKNTMKYIKMGFSSNFGNMFSMMGASAFLPFLPMMPSQILLNNFLYDMSQTTLSTDNIDHEDTKNPMHFEMKYFGKYIIVFGIVSSLFDFLTFFLLYKVFHLMESGFQTGWFIASITTQIFIVYVIRTKRVPFLKSRPGKWVVASTLLVASLAWIIPHTPLGALFSFALLPGMTLAAIMGIVLTYLLVGEVVKFLFYRKYPAAP